jgi:anthranilate phosphoribosyltransferase
VLKEAIARLVEGKSLTRQEISTVFEEIFSGQGTQAQLGAFLVALRMKGETSEEIAGAAAVMRDKATVVRVPSGRPVLDTCGTGGDGAHTFNISTAVAFVAAAGGATVAKHGNRSVSSSCGSADVLAAAGVNIDAGVPVVERCLEEVGIGFLFAPALHGVMKHVIGPRREVGVRSIFNLLGPLANPARAPRQLLGVYDRKLVPVLAQTLAALGAERALVVHGEDGLDEVSPCAHTFAALVDDGSVEELILSPEQAGLERVSAADLKGGDPAYNAARLKEVLEGRPGPLRTAVALNAGAALWVAALAESLSDGVKKAQALLDRGAPREKLEALVRLTQEPHA